MRDAAISTTIAAKFVSKHDLTPIPGLLMFGRVLLCCATLGLPAMCLADPTPPASKPRIEAALQNVTTLQRSGQEGYATIWDGNKYIQCGHTPDGGLRCEAAGTLMQPSLAPVLVPERVSRLAALGWRLDPSFGNYVQSFPADATPSLVADKILQALAEGYDAQLDALEVASDWVANEPCPPRNGPGQNLAGMVNDAAAMAATAVHACHYAPEPGLAAARPGASTEALIALYGLRVTGELQRLRVNLARQVFVIFETAIGYVQCGPETSPAAIYCEAQSAESWPALAAVLTPERVARLHAAGFTDPGRAPNYWKLYPADQFTDAAIAGELLTILHDVYGYDGSWKLQVKTEKDS